MRTAHRVAEERQALGMTQRQLARLLGIDQAQVCRIETGEQRLTADLAVEISAIVGVTLDRLMNRLPHALCARPPKKTERQAACK